MIKYISTRGGCTDRTFEDVLLTGLAPDGGLYVPETFPELDLDELRGASYKDVAFAVMYPFVEGCIPADVFREIIAETYSTDIFPDEVVTLRELDNHLYVMEQFHGPTMAFKDVALQLLGRLFDYVLAQRNEHVTIVGATSGDTGSAAIEGCRHSGRTNIFILFPEGRVSEVQRRQMTTVNAPNVHNIALKGTFDDCQNAVKSMFGDHDFRREMRLSAVNSINWARIMAQIVYYVHTALQLEQRPRFVVPTGNFGNVLAGYYARRMGVDLDLVVATNKNDILTRFFESGEMRADGVSATMSPSMDIQISSNFERYLFEALDRDTEALKALMETFKSDGAFKAPDQAYAAAVKDFEAFRALEDETKETIKEIHQKYGYVLDPHTAVGMKGALGMNKESPVVVLATAHPAKFPDAVASATSSRPDLPDYLSDLYDRTEHFDVLDDDAELIKGFIRSKARA